MGDRESLERRVRRFLNEEKSFRYKKTTTTSAGASTGATVISTNLTQVDDSWNGCIVRILSGNAEGQERTVEDFANSTGTLTFTNNVFPVQIDSGVSIEIFEVGSWSGSSIEQALLDSINYVAALVPKEALEDYIVTETVGAVSGVADPPTSALDIHHITINGKPAVPISSKRYRRIISGQDSYLNPVGTTRYLYFFSGKDSTNGQLRFAPSGSFDVVYHKTPIAAWNSDGDITNFPDKLWQAVVCYSCSLLWDAAEDYDAARIWGSRTLDYLSSIGVEIKAKFRQEVRTSSKRPQAA